MAVSTNGIGNGTIEPMSQVVHSKQEPAKRQQEDDLRLVIQSFRLLIADLCQQFNMGHPGLVSSCRAEQISEILTQTLLGPEVQWAWQQSV